MGLLRKDTFPLPFFPTLWQYLGGAWAAGLTGTPPPVLVLENHTHPSEPGSMCSLYQGWGKSPILYSWVLRLM